MSRDERFDRACTRLGCRFDGEIGVGGNYVPVKRRHGEVFVSGQIPRVGDAVVVQGRAGAEVPLDEARRAAAICALRALALLQRELGSLDAIDEILRIGVFVASAEDFTQQSEVADGASDLLHEVLGEAGTHVRTSVGAFCLPKNATVELELVAALNPDPAPVPPSPFPYDSTNTP
jgi:enamine deaminase RidA (YjgF/YER057c/UK114 family)